MLLGAGTATLVLLVSTAGFVLLESLDSRHSAERESSMVSKIVVAAASPAVAFGDTAAAVRTLGFLSEVTSVTRACIYDANRKVFAEYLRHPERNSPGCPKTAPSGTSVREGLIGLTSPLLVGTEAIGSFYLESSIESLRARIARKASVSIPLLLAAVALAVLFAMRVQRRITDPIQKLVESVRAMAGGDLSVTPKVTGVREVAVLSRAFGEMAGKLRGLIDQTRASTTAVAETVEVLRESSDRLGRDARSQEEAVAESAQSLEQIGSAIDAVSAHAEALSEIADETSSSLRSIDASISQVAEHASELANSVDGTAASVSEMRESIELTSQNVVPLRKSTETTVLSVQALSHSIETVGQFADQCDQLASGTAAEATRGQRVVEESIEGSLRIRNEFDEIERVVSELSVQSEAIGDFIHLISEVADETGLLALNASIIAAQAGDEGRPFAVVAARVRTLAGRSATTVDEISVLVAKVLQSTRDTAKLVAAGSRRVRQESVHWEEAGLALREIGAIADQSASIASQIAEATRSQVAELDRVSANAIHVDEVSQQIAQATDQQRRANVNIEETADRLRQLSRRLQDVANVQRVESRSMEGARERIAEIAEVSMAQHERRAQLERALRVFRSGTSVSAQHAAELEKVVDDLSRRSTAVEQVLDRFGH